MFTIALTMLGTIGCATMSDKGASQNKSFMDRMPWVDKDSDESQPYPQPTKLAATWTPDTLIQTGRTPTRGFGGRIFFYNQKSQPVPVDGTLIVHGFDETANTPQQGVKRFEFTPEQFTKHFSKSDLGASYSVWIPWDAVGGDRKRISLVASFKTVDGKAVQGLPAVVMLPGNSPEVTGQDKMAAMSPQFRDHKSALASRTTKTSGLTTTTITRRKYSPNTDEPSINVPNVPVGVKGENESLLAQQTPTPSVEISMNRRPQTPDIMPASAELPVNHKAAQQDSTGSRWPGDLRFPSLRK